MYFFFKLKSVLRLSIHNILIYWEAIWKCPTMRNGVLILLTD